jgi:hypothetical protein
VAKRLVRDLLLSEESLGGSVTGKPYKARWRLEDVDRSVLTHDTWPRMLFYGSQLDLHCILYM